MTEERYRELIIHYHRKGRGDKCPYCGELWPCAVYREMSEQLRSEFKHRKL
jgi:hypothetical protein